jgi:hypothetical protein
MELTVKNLIFAYTRTARAFAKDQLEVGTGLRPAPA